MNQEDLSKIDYSNLLTCLKEVQIDVYLQLSDEKFVRIISNKSNEAIEILEKYHEKGVTFFFVKNQFVQQIKNQLIDDLKKSLQAVRDEEATLKERVGAAQELVGELRSLVKSLGISDEVKMATEEAIDALYLLSSESAALESLLEVIKGKGAYIQKHGLLSAFVSVSLASEFFWGNEELKRGLVLASLLQDISLDSDRLAKIYERSSEEFRNLSPSQKEVVLNHTTYSALMIEGVNDLSSEASRLIKNHHENPEGTGFLKRLNYGNTGPIDACFIISVYFSHLLLKNEPLEDHKVFEIAQSMNDAYHVGNYKNIYKKFHNVFSRFQTKG